MCARVCLIFLGSSNVSVHVLICLLCLCISTSSTTEYVDYVWVLLANRLNGAEKIEAALTSHLGIHVGETTKDGMFTLGEMECMGACVNAPMLQIGKDFYEDLDGPKTEQLIADLKAGKPLKPGPANGRRSSEPEGGATSLTDPSLYDGSIIGKYEPKAPPPPPPADKKPGAA